MEVLILLEKKKNIVYLAKYIWFLKTNKYKDLKFGRKNDA